MLSMSCSHILFKEPMPRSAVSVREFPENVEGDYIQLYAYYNRVNVKLLKLRRLSDSKFAVYEQWLNLVDSSSWANSQLPRIDTAWFKDQQIYIKYGYITKIVELSDTIKSREEQLMYYMDLEQGLSFNPNSGDSSQIVLLKSGKSYFLNELYLEDDYVVKRIEFYAGDLVVEPLGLASGDSSLWKQAIIKNYALDAVVKDHMRSTMQHYRADLSDERFFQLMEAVFAENHPIRWQLVEEKKGFAWIWGLVGLLLCFIFFASRLLRKGR